jgi:NADH-quinone oxidoreductase subunit H
VGSFLGNVINVVVFILKGWMLVFVMMWVRWTLPRLRIDQVMMTCLKYLLPISCALLLGVSLWQVAMPPVVSKYLKYGMSGVCVVLVAWMVWKLATTHSKLPAGGVPNFMTTGKYPLASRN